MEKPPMPYPVTDCATCQHQYWQLMDLYRLWITAPGDPGAKGLFEASREDYEAHIRQKHSRQAKLMTSET